MSMSELRGERGGDSRSGISISSGKSGQEKGEGDLRLSKAKKLLQKFVMSLEGMPNSLGSDE